MRTYSPFYLSAEGRERIEERVRERILDVRRWIQEGDGRAWEDPAYGEALGEGVQAEWESRDTAYVSIVGDSLGSVIPYDVAYDFHGEITPPEGERAPIRMLKEICPASGVQDICVDLDSLRDLLFAFIDPKAHSFYWENRTVAREIGVRLLADHPRWGG